MKKLTFRIDDVSCNTDLVALKKMIKLLKDLFICEVWCCVNLISKQTFDGAVYPGVPFKDKPRDFFYDVNQWFDTTRFNIGQDMNVSHGLFHVDHSSIQYDAQEMSIVGSCNILKTHVFVPPFNRFNQTTESVCNHHLIRLVRSNEEGWLSLEHNDFDPRKNLWYFHPWRYDYESFRKKINGKKLGLVQRHDVCGSGRGKA